MKTGNVSDDRALEERTKLLFDESVSSLDPQTRSKLTQARYRALEELEGSSPAAPAGWRRGGYRRACLLRACLS